MAQAVQRAHPERGIADVNLRHLRYFVVLAEELHYGRAAARLGISQPPLSEQILALESGLGTLLFQRTRRQVVLTASGRTLYGEAIKLLQHAERLREVMASTRSGFAGQLYLGCVPSSLLGALPLILGERGKIGDLEIRVTEGHTGEIVTALRDGRLDAGLVWEDDPDPPLAIRPLEHVRFIAAIHPSHPLAAKKRRVALADFTGEPLIVPPRDVTPRQFDRIMAGFHNAGLSPRIGQHARSIAAQLGFVASGLGYALVPEYARRLAMAGVVFKPLREMLESAPLSLMWNTTRMPAQLAAFRERVEEAFPGRGRRG